MKIITFLMVLGMLLCQNPTEEKAATTVKKSLDAVETNDVTVAVIDSGYDMEGCGKERILEGVNFSKEGSVQDENGHGTLMANIILEHTKDGVNVMPIKVADREGRASSLKIYLGICYAIENGADIINISVSAYKSRNGKLVQTAIEQAVNQGIFVVVSAGNYGENTKNYIPANVNDAIVVSAVGTDETITKYSNYGETIDYCAIGSIKGTGIGNEKKRISGTSVSAAIVSAIISDRKERQRDISYQEVLNMLRRQAKDLGEPGQDFCYGNGMLKMENMMEEEPEEKEETQKPELLRCDWKKLSDQQLNKQISSADELTQRRFLDQLSQEDRKELLDREDILYHHEHTAIVYDVRMKEVSRFNGTLLEYLYSEFFDEYIVQKNVSKTYGRYNGNQPYWAASLEGYVAVNTSLDNTLVPIKLSQSGGQPTDAYTVTISATNAGAFRFGEMELAGRFLSGDDNGHNLGNTPVPMAIFLKGVKVVKSKHSYGVGQSRTKEQTNTRLVVGGFYKPDSNTIVDSNCKRIPKHISASYGNNQCTDGLTENVHIMMSIYELSTDVNHISQIFTMKFAEYGAFWGEWSEWSVIQNSTCWQSGLKSRMRQAACNNCGAAVDNQTQTESVPQLAHDFTDVPWNYSENNGVARGLRYHECKYGCGENGGSGYDVNGNWWQKDVQYYQHIEFREMDINGEYGEYKKHIEGYYDVGSLVLACGTEDTVSVELLPASNGVGAYEVQQAMERYIDIDRKQYRIEFNGNGADSGNTLPNGKVYAGKNVFLHGNGYQRTGYKFVGWSQNKEANKAEWQDKEKVRNLSMIHNATVTLYAVWEPMYEIKFENNLTATDEEILKKDSGGISLEMLISKPVTKWKEKGKGITINFQPAVINDAVLNKLYRFKGWSLTSEISNEDEIVLSPDKNDYTFTADKNLILYAQWDTEFSVAYIGNEQSSGSDCFEQVKDIKDTYIFRQNDKAQRAFYLEKNLEKPTIDLETGETVGKNGTPCMETVPCSFQGWSMNKDSKVQRKNKVYKKEDGYFECAKIIEEAKAVCVDGKGEGLTFDKGKPVVTMYAVWDEYPQIAASDLYFPLNYAKEGRISKEFLLQYAVATDEEGTTSLTLLDYQESDFLGAEGEMALTINYCAKDTVGNTTTKMVTIYLVDTTAKEYTEGKVRFISAEHKDTLAEKSIWRTGEYATVLAKTLGNRKTGEEYSVVTPLQQVLGAKSVKKPGSGSWNHVEEIWKFTNEDVQSVQDYIAEHGITEEQEVFLSTFDYCRVQ